MDWTNPSAQENEPASGKRLERETVVQPPPSVLEQPGQSISPLHGDPANGQLPQLRIGKSLTLSAAAGKEVNLEVFTLTLGGETIELLPLKSWSQLDRHKWTVRGKLPAEPAGLEITFDHVRIAGQTVALDDPAGCMKLEQLFHEWLLLEKKTLESGRKKTHPQNLSAAPEPYPQPGSIAQRFRVEVDKRGQIRIHFVQGRDTVASVGLTAAGFSSLCQQGLMRKPHTLKTGVLHDWVELDGELFSFEKSSNDATGLEQILNQRYLPTDSAGLGKEVIIFHSAASPTGFDIQFPLLVGGVPHNQKQHLNQESLDSLQDSQRCGLMHREIIIKLMPPNLVFKQRTADGGEEYLPHRPQNVVTFSDDDGQPHNIDLSQTLNLLRLSAQELTAVFNHPTINRHTKTVAPGRLATEPQLKPVLPAPPTQAHTQPVSPAQQPSKEGILPQARTPVPGPTAVKPTTPPPASTPRPAAVEPRDKPVEVVTPLPNLWLKEILAQPVHRPDWFACLAYSKIAERFGNSTAGKFGPVACWFISLGEPEDIADPAFKGIFLTEKGSLGFLHKGQMARFYNGIAFLGPLESALDGIHVNLTAVGLDSRERIVFVLSDDYRLQFDVPEAILTEVLIRLSAAGAVIMSVTETLASRNPLEVVWTVPEAQPESTDPQALESTRPTA